jgi:hypothetical protein
MMQPIPAPGFREISGKRRPPASMGDELWCQIRTGWVDMHGPWPVETTRWKHDGSAGDVVAIKQVERTK